MCQASSRNSIATTTRKSSKARFAPKSIRVPIKRVVDQNKANLCRPRRSSKRTRPASVYAQLTYRSLMCGWRRPTQSPKTRSTTQRTLLDQAQSRRSTLTKRHRAAPGPARGCAGQSRLHQYHLAGGRHRGLAQRYCGPDGRGQLPDADAVPDRHRPHQDAGRHQCQRKRHRRHQGRQQGFLHRRRLSQAHLSGHRRPGAAVAANNPERRHL